MGRIFVSNLVPLLLIIGGVILAILGIKGWGWLLFLAAAHGTVISAESKKNKKR